MSPFDATWFRLIVGLVTGLTLGSFVTMLSYRLPRHLSIIKPGSHCPACKTPLKPRDLVPVVSWVVQRGKCRYCGTFTGWRYVLIEIVMALAGGGGIHHLRLHAFAADPAGSDRDVGHGACRLAGALNARTGNLPLHAQALVLAPQTGVFGRQIRPGRRDRRLRTTRRQFTDKFKRESVGLLASSGRPLSQIARELGIAASTLRSWRDAGDRGNAGSTGAGE